MVANNLCQTLRLWPEFVSCSFQQSNWSFWTTAYQQRLLPTVSFGLRKMSSSAITDSEESSPKPTYEELENEVSKLKAQVANLNSIIQKKDLPRRTKTKKERPIDFTRYNTRRVAFKVAYFGWDYLGFAKQDNSDNTIETALMNALLTAKLIQPGESSRFSKCGRTDKGVSAFSQVISLDVRTNLLEGVGVIARENGTASERPGDKDTELPFIRMLNRLLPQEIRVLAWCPVDPSFSARFCCNGRTYKYFFPKADMNIELMKEAASKLVGEHDFRNFCKMAVRNGIINYTRVIYSVTVSPVGDGKTQGIPGSDMHVVTVVGTAYLWHQIRCIMAVLFLIGQGKESPDVVDQLLDIEHVPRRPLYMMASEIPLVLFDSKYEEIDWIYEPDNISVVLNQLQRMWTINAIKSTQVGSLLAELAAGTEAEQAGSASEMIEALSTGTRYRDYKPMFKGPLGPTFEEKLASAAKQKRVSPEELLESLKKRRCRSDSDEESSQACI